MFSICLACNSDFYDIVSTLAGEIRRKVNCYKQKGGHQQRQTMTKVRNVIEAQWIWFVCFLFFNVPRSTV